MEEIKKNKFDMAIPAEIADYDGPPALHSIWDDETSALYAKLRPQQQEMLIALMTEKSQADAWRKVYGQGREVTPLMARRNGSRAFNNVTFAYFFDRFAQRKREAMQVVADTYFDMIEATKSHWIPNPNGEGDMINAGFEPDWQARDKACTGLSKLYDLHAPTKIEVTIDSTKTVPAQFTQQFNFFLTQKGLPAIEMDADDGDIIDKPSQKPEVNTHTPKTAAEKFKHFAGLT